MNRRAWDTVVIGGGLAGCSAALTMADEGFGTLLLEAKHYPRDKVCGEFISPEGAAFLSEVTACPGFLRDVAVPINGARVTTPGGVVWSPRLPAAGMGISRHVLDDALIHTVRQRGVTALEGAEVVAVRGNLARGFELDVRRSGAVETVLARAVIGAYGKQSRLDRDLKRQFTRRSHPYIGLKAHFNGPSLKDRTELHAFPGGYCGLVDVEGGRQNVCLIVRQPAMTLHSKGAADPLQNFERWMEQQNPAISTWWSQARRISPQWMAIAQVPLVQKEAVVGDIFMTGDAAGMIAPLAGDGMSMALEAGALAGGLLAQFLDGRAGADAVRSRYAQMWNERFSLRLRFGLFLQSVLTSPRAAGPGVGLLRVAPLLGRMVVGKTRGEPVSGWPSVIGVDKGEKAHA